MQCCAGSNLMEAVGQYSQVFVGGLMLQVGDESECIRFLKETEYFFKVTRLKQVQIGAAGGKTGDGAQPQKC